mmetsp:Transcript_90385/g.264472  ORF Transcript_90385/g.264472 Transcript_90385/m.264472 type:complete len:204 (+) Transcript_90385:129-740(+)
MELSDVFIVLRLARSLQRVVVPLPHKLKPKAREGAQGYANGLAVLLVPQQRHADVVFVLVGDVQDAEGEAEGHPHGQGDAEDERDLVRALHNRLGQRRLAEPNHIVQDIDDRECHCEGDCGAKDCIQRDLHPWPQANKHLPVKQEAKEATQHDDAGKDGKVELGERQRLCSLVRGDPPQDQAPYEDEEAPKVHGEHRGDGDLH